MRNRLMLLKQQLLQRLLSLPMFCRAPIQTRRRPRVLQARRWSI